MGEEELQNKLTPLKRDFPREENEVGEASHWPRIFNYQLCMGPLNLVACVSHHESGSDPLH